MATFLKSANFDGYNGSHFYISLYYDILSQSSASNQSVVRYYLYVGSSDGYSGYGSYSSGYIGDTWVGGLSSIGVNSFNYIGSRDITYTHNEDGTSPTIYYWASFGTNWGGVGSASLSDSFTLPTILRYPIATDGTNFTDEENPVLTFSNAGIYGLRATMNVGLTQIYSSNISDNTVTSHTYNLTTSQRNQLRQLCTGKTMPVILSIKAIEDGSVVNTSSTTVTMSMVNAEPTFTYTMVETNQNVIDVLGGSSASSLIDNVSQVKITVSPTTKKYATVSNVSVSLDGNTYNDNTSPYEITVPVTDNNFTISLVDSRGYTTTKTDTARTLISYEPLKINGFSFVRESPISSNVILNAEILYYDSIGSTTNVPVVKWKLDNGNYTTIPGSAYTIDSQNHKLTITDYELTNVLAYNLQGQFTLYVADLLTETQDAGASGLVLKGVPTFDVGEHDLQVNGDLYVADTQRNNKVNILTEINNLKPTVLYSSISGTSGNVTLTESAGNYTTIEVFFEVEDYKGSTKFLYEQNKTFTLTGQWVDSYANLYNYANTYSINGTSITYINGIKNYISQNNTVGNFGTANTSKIYLVLGYK